MMDPQNKYKKDSLKKRYFYKLFSNLFGLPIGLVTQSIIPRSLGPRNYGDFNFLTNFFAQFISFFDMGTSICFYTKLSQRQSEFKLVKFYSYFVCAIISLVVIFVIIANAIGIYPKLWPGQGLFYIYLALILGILTWIIQIMSQMSDAYGITVSAELGKVLQRIIGLSIIVVLFVYHKLNLTNFFFYNLLMAFLLIFILFGVMKQHGFNLGMAYTFSFKEVKQYIREFYQYVHPLFAYNLIGMLVGIFDRWLLQVFAGSIQQGFFSLSYQIGGICFLATSAMTNLITREFSIAYNNNDLRHMAVLFRRYIPLLYSITAFFSCFVAVNADKVTLIFGGGKFRDAALAVAIMAFYPIHQTYGQLSNSVFYATGQTRLYRNIGIFFMIIGLFLTYFLIAPKSLSGLNIGATGLALKMVLVQFMAINVQLYFNARFLKLPFLRYIAHQVLSVGCLLLVAVLTIFASNLAIGFPKNILFNFIFSGFLYALIVIFLTYYFPYLFGLNKEDITLITNKLKRRVFTKEF